MDQRIESADTIGKQKIIGRKMREEGRGVRKEMSWWYVVKVVDGGWVERGGLEDGIEW